MFPENPYITGNPVGKSTVFIGRTDILQAVLRVLRHPQDNAIVLYGQRRIGKTSILQALEADLLKENRYCPVAFNLIDKAQESLEQVLQGLARQISQVLSIDPPHFEHDPKATFHQWLSQVLKQPSEEQILVLLFDEFDVLDEPHNMRENFFPYLRDLLAINPQRCKFVFTIGRKIDELNTIALSLFKGIPSQRVSLLDDQETTQLVRLSETNQTLSWSNEAINKIRYWTHGHPHLTQRFCSSVWDDIYDQHPTQLPTATLTDVDTAFIRVLNASRGSLEWLWNGLPPTERVIVSALAQAKSVVKTEADLETLLRQSGVHVQIQIRDLQNALHLLQNWDLIELTIAKGYRFRVELIRFWIAKFKHPAQTQEELDRINPAADSLYKTARQLYQDHHIKEAEDTLRLVIQSKSDHLGANLLLADILVERKQFKAGIEILEKHHCYSPARHRLISALLASAQSGKSKKAQRQLYQRILELEPNHAVAQTQLANMTPQWRQRLNWKQPLFGIKNFFNHYAKRTLQISGFILALWVSYYWLGERLLSEPLIVFEIEQASDLPKYSITGSISDRPSYTLELVKIYPRSNQPIKKATFKYNGYQEIELIKAQKKPYYKVSTKFLQQQLGEDQNFLFKFLDNHRIIFAFEFEQQAKNAEPDCQVFAQDNTEIPCEIREKGYLSLFKNIPWFLAAPALGFLWYLLIELIFFLKNREREDVY